LEGEQRGAHVRDGGDDRGRLAHRMGLERCFIECGWLERLGSGDRCGHIVRAAAGIEQHHGHRAIDQPGIEMAQPVMRGQALAERTLAGGGRTVDGDDQDRHPQCYTNARVRRAAAGVIDRHRPATP